MLYIHIEKRLHGFSKLSLTCYYEKSGLKNQLCVVKLSALPKLNTEVWGLIQPLDC